MREKRERRREEGGGWVGGRRDRESVSEIPVVVGGITFFLACFSFSISARRKASATCLERCMGLKSRAVTEGLGLERERARPPELSAECGDRPTGSGSSGKGLPRPLGKAGNGSVPCCGNTQRDREKERRESE